MDNKGTPLNEWGEDEAAPEQTCLICGCTDSKACEGGCYWILPGICSKCVTDKVPMCIDLLIHAVEERHRLPCARPDCKTCDLIKFAHKMEGALRQ